MCIVNRFAFSMRQLHSHTATVTATVAVSVGVSVVAFTATPQSLPRPATVYLLSRSCLCLRTCYLAISLTANPQWGGSVGEGSGEASNSMPAQIQRMLYTSGRPTWGRRANRAHISHWSLTFSANNEGWQTARSVSNKGCTVGGGKCNNFLLRLINWSASASLSASRCDARRDSAKSVLSTSSDLPLYFAIILAIIFVIIYV